MKIVTILTWATFFAEPYGVEWGQSSVWRYFSWTVKHKNQINRAERVVCEIGGELCDSNTAQKRRVEFACSPMSLFGAFLLPLMKKLVQFTPTCCHFFPEHFSK